MQLNDHFRAFHSNLSLDDGVLGEARTAHRGIREALSRSIPDVLVDTFLHGSFVHQTLIRPRAPSGEFSVDAVIVLRLPDDMAPADAVKWLHAKLAAIPMYASRVVARRRCVRVHFDGFYVDAIPARPSGSVLAVPDRARGQWMETNPKGLTDWHRIQNDRTAGRFARAVRMVKQWCIDTVDDGSQPPTVALEVLVAREVPQTGYDGEVLVRVLRGLSTVLANGRRPLVLNPSLPSEDLARDWSPSSVALFGLHVARASALGAAALNVWDGGASVELWRALFPERFPRAA